MASTTFHADIRRTCKYLNLEGQLTASASDSDVDFLHSQSYSALHICATGRLNARIVCDLTDAHLDAYLSAGSE